MKDVAARAGVGLKTVSRVVNAEPGVTADTAERVRAAIKALGFRRNDSARLLRKGQTASIALIVDDIGNPSCSVLARAVENVAHRSGSLLFMGSSDEDPEREQTLALTFCARRVDGLIIAPASTDHSYLLTEIAAGVAVVFVSRPPGVIDADIVLTDNRVAARTGAEHLIRQGHRRIGHIGATTQAYTAQQRLMGYRDAMAAARLPVQEDWAAMVDGTPAAIHEVLGCMLGPGGGPEATAPGVKAGTAGRTPVTALLCGDNSICGYVLREVAARSAHVAVVCLEDAGLADRLSPGVTVVACDLAEMGRIAAELLFRRLSGEHGSPRRVEVPTRLIARGSGEVPPR